MSAARLLFGWVPVDDRAYDRAWRVQETLTQRGQHRSAGAVDLVVAATAELQGLPLRSGNRVALCQRGLCTRESSPSRVSEASRAKRRARSRAHSERRSLKPCP